MNLEESDSFKDEIEKNIRQRRSVMLSIVVCAMIAALLFVMIMILKYQDSITLKMFLNDKQVKIPNGFYREINGKTYVDVKEIATLLGYTYTKGEYGEYNENPDSCYLENDYELIALTAGNEKYKKYIQFANKGREVAIADIPVVTMESNGYSESFLIADAPIEFVDDKLYVCRDYLPEMFNMQVNWQEFRIKFYSFEKLLEAAKERVAKSQYTTMSGYYENLRSVVYGLAVVGTDENNPDNGLYGVISLEDLTEVIGPKYDQIEFVQNTKEFYITVANGTKGILGADGSTIIKQSEYKDIELLDEENKVYLVEKDGEYGVLDKHGKVIIHAENDKIGYDITNFTVESIDNPALLFKKCIPVEKDGKFGLYNLEGEPLLDIVNDALGCVSNKGAQTSGNKQNVLIIPSKVGINGIVYSFNGYYGIYDVNEEKPVIPPACESVYAITKSGETIYYFDYNGVTYDLKQYLADNGLANIKEEESKETAETPTEEVQPDEQPAE